MRSMITLVVLLLALVLGGSGAAPWMELALQLVFAFAAWLLLLDHWRGSIWPTVPPAAWLIAGLVLALPILQLIPLPPWIWQALPGRETERDALALIDAANAWMPWSMTPDRTLATLLAMVPPVLLFLLATLLAPAWRRAGLALIVALGLANSLLGSLQLAAGEAGDWRLYEETHLLFVTGFFANRNAAADMILIAILALAAHWSTSPQRPGAKQGLVSLAVGAALVLTLLLTGSRMGIALLLPVLLVAAVLIGLAWDRNSPFLRPVTLLGGLGAVGLVAGLALQLPTLRPVVARFLFAGDNRWMIWEDMQVAIAGVWPVGSGLGSFQPIFLASQRLEYVEPSMPISAHNDWLEFTLEAGAVGWALLLAIGLILIWQARNNWQAKSGTAQASRRQQAQILFAIGTLGVIALHSLVDYPLRTMALACLSAFAAAMIFPAPAASGSKGAGSAD